MAEWMKAVLLIYAPITALVFLVAASGFEEFRRVPGARAARERAMWSRWALAAPLWPLTALVLALVWLGGIVRAALGGAPDDR